MNWIIIFLFVLSYLKSRIYSFILKDPNYSLDYINPSFEQKPNLRQSFLDKRKHNRVTAKRVEMMDKYLSNDSIFIDGLMHELVNEKYIHLARVQEIENAFKNLIHFNGFKSIYKRDHHWLTWRKVKYSDGERNVCYKCQRSPNCKDCQYGGYWIIDEDPPCPYEIISTINSAKVCAINMKNNTNMNHTCPSVVLFNDILSSCDNPIDTKWQLRRDYNAEVSERNLALLCKGREFCEISTYYLITPKHVKFRITNSTNHILYSKIMKYNNQTYVCVEDCGSIDPITKTVSKTDKPLYIEIEITKTKREDKQIDDFNDDSKSENDNNKTTNKKIKPTKKLIKKNINNSDQLKPFTNKNIIRTIENNISVVKKLDNSKNNNKMVSIQSKKYSDQTVPEKSFNHKLVNNNHHHHHDKKNPTCSSLKHLMDENLSEDIETYYNRS